MAQGWVDRVIFNAASGGTGNFVVASAVQGYNTPAQSSAVNGTLYHYAAQSHDLTQWEVGTGAYTSATSTLARTTIEFSTNSNAKVNFSAPPQVMITALAADFGAASLVAGTTPITSGTDTAVLFQSGGVLSEDAAKFSWTDSTGYLNLATGVTSAGTELVLQQTGDTLGTTKLHLQDRSGAAGGILENLGLDAVELGFKPSVGPQTTLRFQHDNSFLPVPNQSGTAGAASGEYQFVLDSLGTPIVPLVFGYGAFAFNALGNIIFEFNTTFTNQLVFRADIVGLYDLGGQPGNLNTGTITYIPTTIAGLPGAPALGQIASVSDGDSGIVVGNVVHNSGSGATTYLVWWDGTTWTVLANLSSQGDIPQNSRSANYTTTLEDIGRTIFHPTSDNNARTFTIASNTAVAYPIGTAITFVNNINTLTLTTADLMTLAGSTSTTSRAVAAHGIATILKIGTVEWIISGTGLT